MGSMLGVLLGAALAFGAGQEPNRAVSDECDGADPIPFNLKKPIRVGERLFGKLRKRDRYMFRHGNFL